MNIAIAEAIHEGIIMAAVNTPKIDLRQNIIAVVVASMAKTDAVATVNFLPNIRKK